MVLNDRDILQLKASDDDFISPFSDANLQAASYDVSLSNYVQELSPVSGEVISPADQSLIDAIYKKVDISGGYLLKPGQYILCPIVEFISLPDDIIAHIRPRTRLTRFGLLVAPQHCNPGYKGRLSLGMQNASPNNIALVPNIKIAQLVFEHLDSIPSRERLYQNKTDAAYYEEDDFIGAKFDDKELNAGASAILKDMLKRLSIGKA